MPHHEISIEDVLCKTKDRKSSKKTPCNVDCCIPDCNPECCTAAFQRLDKLRMDWLLTQQGEYAFGFTDNSGNTPVVYNRAAVPVPIPTTTPAVDPSGTTYPLGTLEQTAFGFVNTVRYLNFEECGKLDQVTGWSVDVQYGDLYLYQDLPELGLTTSDSRAYLINLPPQSITTFDSKKLNAMEPFWKLSLKAIERVRENPKTEGNICEIKDKCGNKFLVAINRTGAQSTTSICNYNSKYSIVVVKLC